MSINKNHEQLNLKQEVKKALDSEVPTTPEYMEMRKKLDKKNIIENGSITLDRLLSKTLLQQRLKLSREISENWIVPLNKNTFLKISKELTSNDSEKQKFLREIDLETKEFFWFLEIFKNQNWKKQDLDSLYIAFPTTLEVKKYLNLLMKSKNFEDYIIWIETTLWDPNIKNWFENVTKWNIAILQDMVNTEKYAISSLNKKKKLDLKDYDNIADWIKALKTTSLDWWKSYLQVIEETLGKESWIFLWDIKLDDLLIEWDLVDTSNLDKINTKIKREKDNLMNFSKLVKKDWEVFKTSIQKNYKMRLINWDVKEINEKYDVYLNTMWNQILVIKNNLNS